MVGRTISKCRAEERPISKTREEQPANGVQENVEGKCTARSKEQPEVLSAAEIQRNTKTKKICDKDSIFKHKPRSACIVLCKSYPL